MPSMRIPVLIPFIGARANDGRMRRLNSNDCIRNAFACILHFDPSAWKLNGRTCFCELIEFLERMLEGRTLERIALGGHERG